MTEPKQIDLQSLRIQAGYQAGHSIDTLIRSYAQNTAGALAVAEAQKAMAEEQVAELKKTVAKLEAALAEARGEVSGEPMARKAGKAGKPAS